MALAVMDLIQRVVPAMVGSGGGRIVNATSAALHTSTPLAGWYVARKAPPPRSWPGAARPGPHTGVMKRLCGATTHLVSPPERFAAAVVGVLSSDRPPARRRVGPDAAGMRIVGDLVPDRVWDPLVQRLARSL